MHSAAFRVTESNVFVLKTSQEILKLNVWGSHQHVTAHLTALSQYSARIVSVCLRAHLMKTAQSMRDVFKGFACVSSSIISSLYVSTFSELTNIFSIFQFNICSDMLGWQWLFPGPCVSQQDVFCGMSSKFWLPRVQYLHQQLLHGSLQRRHLWT